MIALVCIQVAYVLGQLQNKDAISVLSKVLEDVNEHPMVRHEAAEALGSIAGILIFVIVEQNGIYVLASHEIFRILIAVENR